jgi:4-carboxymuconolactone decarboxylase
MIPPRIDIDAVRDRIGEYADPVQSADQRARIYRELLGFVPPRIEARIHVTGALDPRLLDLQEQMRAHAMYPTCFDVKTVQLMLFGMLLMDLNDAAMLHGIAARRAGADWEQMQAVVSLAFLFRGLSAANRGAELLASIAKREADAEAQGEAGDAKREQ